MNKKFYLFLVGTTLLSGLFVSSAFGYGVETHAYLTKEVIAFYNAHFPKQTIPEELAAYLIDGARNEDNAPRFLNHFYDPVNNRGLADGAYRGRKSKDWAQNEKSQTALLYKLFPDTEKSILTASQLDKIKPIFSKTNFTWQKAIKLYADGETEQALFALGHILHLIEDASVPDHTRNDAHPPYDNGGSPYENWTHKFDLENPDLELAGRLKNKKPILLGGLDEYFDGMATYSNNNFYSRDSIKNYELPKSDYIKEVNSENYVFRKDEEFGDYPLATASGKFQWSNVGPISIKPKFVLGNYWSRLSTKAVQYSAGVINLFLQEAEAAREKLALQKAQRPYLATLTDGIKSIFGNDNRSIDQIVEEAAKPKDRDGFNLVAEIPIAQPKVEQKVEQKSESKTEPTTQATVIKNLIPETSSPAPSPEIETEIVSLNLCGFNTNQSPSRQTVIINEVAWMGTHESPNNEWFELKNIGGNPLNISGWQILDKDEQIKIVIPTDTHLLDGGFYLFERNSDEVVPGAPADFIYEASGNGAPSLKNTDEGLRLFDSNCNLIDEVFANPEWPAGESNTRRTMERSADFSWHTYLGNGENGILGTPRKENSLPPSVYDSSGGGGGGSSSSSSSSSSNSQNSGAQNNQAAQEVALSPAKILITEVQINPTGSRFIELYNPNESSVDLSGWYLQRKTQTGSSFGSLISKTYFENKTINADSYFVISRNALEGADIVLDNLTLTESNTIQLKNLNGDVVDKVGWGEATDCDVNCATQPSENQSIQRKFQNDTFVDTDNNATDFEVQNCPSPKTHETTCPAPAAQSNQAPSAFFDYAPKDPKIGDSITFDAASSTDPDGSIAFYQWDFGDGETTTAAQSTVVHSYSAANNYTIQLTVLDNQNASSTATSTAVYVNLAEVSNTNVNHVLISEILFDAEGPDSGKEFIELYNPSEQSVDISGWSVQHVSASGNLTKKNFENGDSVAAKSFFLVWLGSDARADMTWASGSLNNTAATIYIINDTNPVTATSTTIVDGVNYDTAQLNGFAGGKSLERKAFQSGSCVSAQNAGEYLGNGCDTDGSAGSPQDDFELRTSPNPQNTQSLPEPRSAPVAVQNFNAIYSPSNLELTFNWDSNPALSYQIVDVSGASPVILNQATTTGSTTKISEIGREYKFEITAIDAEGLSSDAVQATIGVPSFLDSVSFYQDPRATTSPEYLLELGWSSYPFIPINLKHLVSKQYVANSWHAVIFYYNQNAPETDDLFWINYNPNTAYKSWGLTAPEGFKIKYPNCFGATYETAGASLILPETINDCSSLADNYSSYALNWNQLEDNHLLLMAGSENFATSVPAANQDYVTAAFYAYQPGYEPNNYGLKLLAVDKNKYYFQNTAANHQPPTAPPNVVFDFNSQLSLLKVSWDKSTDSDTLDNLITYEISYNGVSTTTAGNNFLEILAEPEATYDFELRAKDDFSNFSATTTISYDTPDVPLLFELSDISWGHLDGLDSVALNLEFNEYPFMDDDAPSAMIFFLNQTPPANYSFLDDDYRNGANMGGSNNFLKLSYFPCDFNGGWTNKVTAGGAIFNNADCPTNSSLAMSSLLLAKLSGEDIQFTADVINDQEFSENDYITIGFYKLGPRAQNGTAYFANIANYNKKIYFQ